MKPTKYDCVDNWAPGLKFRHKTLNTKSVTRAKTPADVLSVCLAHNLREGNKGHRHRSRIDPDRKHLNEVWAGPAKLADAMALVSDTLEALDLQPKRRDTIMGIEFVIQPPAGVNLRAFWAESLTWVSRNYEHIVSATVHHDQKRPHMHVLVLAVSHGRFAGNDMTAWPNRPKQRRADYMQHMRESLSLRPDRKVKTLADLFVSSGRGPKTRLGAERRDEKLLSLVCGKPAHVNVGMGVHAPEVAKLPVAGPCFKQPPVIAQLSRQEKMQLHQALTAELYGSLNEAPHADESDPLRMREEEIPAAYWDADLGEFRPPPPPPDKPTKAAAQAWVASALRRIQPRERAQIPK